MFRSLTAIAIALLSATAASSQLDPSRAALYHQGSVGVRGVLEDDAFGAALARGDFNGDGWPDLAVSSRLETVNGVDQAGAVHVFYGNPSGFNVDDPDDQIFTQATAGVASVAEPGDQWGSALAAGDFDRDGFDDLAIGAGAESVGVLDEAGAVTVLYGTESGLTTDGSQTFAQDSVDDGNTMPGIPEIGDRFGSVLVVGDFNGDRYQDLAIGVPGENIPLLPGNSHGAVQILYGTKDGLRILKTLLNGSGYLNQAKPAATEPISDEQFGSALAVGDFDGDRRDDLVVGVPRDSDLYNLGGALNVFYGADGGLQTSIEVDVFEEIGECGGGNFHQFGSTVTVGDFDGDGYDDVAATTWGLIGRSICFVYGSPGGLGKGFASIKRATEVALPYVDLLLTINASGDFDDDRYDDLAIYSDGPGDLEAGLIHIGYGSPAGIQPAGVHLEQGQGGMPGERSLLDTFGRAMLAGDVTGDGVDDLVAGAPGDEILGVDDAGSITIVPGTPPTIVPCFPGPDELCLGERFRVTLEWQTESDSGIGKPADQGSVDSGMFWFFEPDNWEMLVKVLDGCGVNNRFWVFAAPTTDVSYRLTLVDEATGETVVYENALGQPAQALADVDAFSSSCGVTSQTSSPRLEVSEISEARRSTDTSVDQFVMASPGMGTCVADDQTMCLLDDRFELTVTGRSHSNPVGIPFEGTVAPAGTANSGIFWFFEADNWEMLVKVLDGCAITGHWWVYAAAATDVEYSLDVHDTVTGMTARYSNPLGRLASAETDVFALPCN